jgi:uroporphyrinogen-III synthase
VIACIGEVTAKTVERYVKKPEIVSKKTNNRISCRRNCKVLFKVKKEKKRRRKEEK